jgi:hypothetical protein
MITKLVSEGPLDPKCDADGMHIGNSRFYPWRAPSAAAVDAGMTENNFPPISQQQWALSHIYWDGLSRCVTLQFTLKLYLAACE